mgnify:FL=1
MYMFSNAGDVVEVVAERTVDDDYEPPLVHNGRIKIIDRVKNYFKLSDGVFVAPSVVEAAIEGCPGVAIRAALVMHTSTAQHAVSVVVQLFRHPSPRLSEQEVLRLVQLQVSEAGLRTHERPAVCVCTTDEWTAQNGLLTASNKLNRLALIKKYRPAVTARWQALLQQGVGGAAGGGAEGRLAAASSVSASSAAAAAEAGRRWGAIVTDAARRVLQVDAVDHALTLEAQGADSLSRMHFIELVPGITFEMASALTVGELVVGAPHTDVPVVDGARLTFDVESFVATHVAACHPAKSFAARAPPQRLLHRPQRVLLTGGSGFFGRALLERMLASTDWHVVVLFHTSEPQRVAPRYRARVTVQRGDVCAENLGLDPEDAAAVDIIVHCAGAVHHLHSYDALFDANVGGARRVLQLSRFRAKGAPITPPKPIFFTSSVSVDQMTAAEAAEEGGYVATKWVAEHTFAEARNRTGQAIGIMRLGMVGWDDRGVNDTDWLSRLLQGCVNIDAIPETQGQTLDIIPREFCAALALRLMQARGAPATWNLINSRNRCSLGSLFAWVVPGVDAIPFEAWIAAAEAQGEKGLMLFAKGLPDDRDEMYDDEATGVAGGGSLEWPIIDQAYAELFRKQINARR